MLITILSFVAIFLFIGMAIVQFIKKDSLKGRKQLKLSGISAVVMIVSFVIFAMTIEPSETAEVDEEVNAKEEAPKETEENVNDTNTEATQKTNSFTIKEEKLSGSIWHVVLLTKDTDEDTLASYMKETIKLAAAKKEKIDSIYVKVNIEDSLAKTYAASGRAALTDLGLAQTGLAEKNKFEINFSLTEAHLTTKEDLPQSNLPYNAETVLKAFQDAGLPTTDSRDNSHNCVELECTTLITTEDVSIYEWPSVEKAKEVQENGIGDGFGNAQVGTIIIRINNKELQAQPYIDVLNKLIGQ